MAKLADVKDGLLAVNAFVKTPVFMEWNKAYYRDNCEHFGYDEEQKLIYTDIFQKYEAEVERQIEEYCSANGVDLAALMQKLASFMDGKMQEEGVEEVAEALDLLSGLGDFEMFRDNMLITRREIEEGEAKTDGDICEGAGSKVVLPNLGGLEDWCAELGSITENNEGWKRVCNKSWIQIDTKPVPGTKFVTYRTSMVSDLSMEHARGLFIDLDRRHEWDDMMGRLDIKKSNKTDGFARDIVVEAGDFKLPFLMKKMMSFPDSMVMRSFLKTDFPAQGCETFVNAPWDLENDKFDHENKVFKLQSGVLKPHPSEEGKCQILMVENAAFGAFTPKWAMDLILTKTSPSMMQKMDRKYRSWLVKTGQIKPPAEPSKKSWFSWGKKKAK